MLDAQPPEIPAAEPVAEVDYLSAASRVVTFRLAPGAGVPETRRTPVLVIAATPTDLEVRGASGAVGRVALRPGESLLLADGLAGATNAGEAEVRFTVIDLAAPAPRPARTAHAGAPAATLSDIR